MGVSEAEVVEVAVDAQGDAAGVDAVVSDAELGVGGVFVWAGFGSGGVGNGGCGVLWE